MSELETKGDEQLNHLLSMSLDVESLFFLVQKEEDTDTKQVHFYLFKVHILWYCCDSQSETLPGKLIDA